MVSIRIILKNGIEFRMKCKKATVKYTAGNEIYGIYYEGATENVPMYVRFSDVSAVVQENVIDNDLCCDIEDGG